MSSLVDNLYSTLEEFLESQRSPTLPRAALNFESSDTPPPLVDAPDDLDPGTSGPCCNPTYLSYLQHSQHRIQPSWTDAILIRHLAPGSDPAIAVQAATEVCWTVPVSSIDDKPFGTAHDHIPMISATSQDDVYNTSDHHTRIQQALTASRRASEKLNDAMRFQHPNLTIQASGFENSGNFSASNHYLSYQARDKKRVSISITSLTNEEASDTPEVARLSIQGSPVDRLASMLPHHRPSLPSLNVANVALQHESMAHSPALSKYALSPQEVNSSQTLARIQSQHSPPSDRSSSSEFKQTLPSLETALSAVSDVHPSYPDPVSAISRRSPNHLSPYGRSPSFSQASANAPLSPPRFSTNPQWRLISQNSSSSGTSEFTTASGSNGISTPGSATAQRSPSQSIATPQYTESEHGSSSSETTHLETSESQSDASGQRSGSISQGFACPWPGCTAPPFQTQYLLNSHTNVHSNTRPHFCPVKGCPRGPGGQGFKRKNEMIRHGLVHESPGYICPFCVDQQHRYPRPDNLQRHVRVHHVDKDRDDPQLRDVLAQRPEGGNRGRRRRLGA